MIKKILLIIMMFSLTYTLFATKTLNQKKKNMNSIKIDAIIKKLNKKLEKNPKDIIAWNNLGHFYELKGNLPQSLEHYQAALKINKYYQSANFGVGNIMFKMAKFNEALVYYEITIKQNPKFWKGYYAIAVTYQVKRNFARAVNYFDKTLKLNPSSIDSYFFLAQCLEALKEYKKAARKYKEFVILAIRHKNKAIYLPFMDMAQNKVKELEKNIK